MNDYQKSIDWPGRTKSVQGISYKQLIQILLSACIQLFLSFLCKEPTLKVGSHKGRFQPCCKYYMDVTDNDKHSSLVRNKVLQNRFRYNFLKKSNFAEQKPEQMAAWKIQRIDKWGGRQGNSAKKRLWKSPQISYLGPIS